MVGTLYLYSIGASLITFTLAYVFFRWVFDRTHQRNIELEEQVSELQQRVVTMRGEHNSFINTVKVEMEKKLNVVEEHYKRQMEERVDRVIREYEEALKLESENLEKRVSELDEQLGEKINEINSKNTMFFTCACDRSKQIPVQVDLSSDDNFFTCPECGAVYRIDISSSTILMSGVSNNVKLANMFDGVEVGDKVKEI